MQRMKRAAAYLLLFAATTVFAQTPPPSATNSLEVKYVRDGAEYATLTRQVYRLATSSALDRAAKRAKGSWGVVLDIDETTLDNSVYQLDRVSYGLSYEQASWGSWILRSEAGMVPGVKDFLDAVRKAGGHVAFITDRTTEWTYADGTKVDSVKPTRENLIRHSLWNEDDRLCLKSTKEDTKAVRRKSVATGEGTCAWPGTRVDVLVFVGDQLGDFPQSGEDFAGAGTDAQFGKSFFLLPNPMYGGWTNSVTRVFGSFK